jgi:hypothetical protein
MKIIEARIRCLLFLDEVMEKFRPPDNSDVVYTPTASSGFNMPTYC